MGPVLVESLGKIVSGFSASVVRIVNGHLPAVFEEFTDELLTTVRDLVPQCDRFCAFMS